MVSSKSIKFVTQNNIIMQAHQSVEAHQPAETHPVAGNSSLYIILAIACLVIFITAFSLTFFRKTTTAEKAH